MNIIELIKTYYKAKLTVMGIEIGFAIVGIFLLICLLVIMKLDSKKPF